MLPFKRALKWKYFSAYQQENRKTNHDRILCSSESKLTTAMGNNLDIAPLFNQELGKKVLEDNTP